MLRPNFVAAQTLLIVARVGTFTGAAEALNTTQSAISARMRELERSLGYPLFTRHGRLLRLTIQAKQLISAIEPLIEALEAAFHDAEAVENPQGIVRIGLAEVATEWFARQVQKLHRELPRLRFELHVDLSSHIHDSLERGELDLGVVAVRQKRPHFRYRSLGRSSLSWVCSESLTINAWNAPRSFAQLLKEECLWLVGEGSQFHSPAREELVDLGAAIDHLCTTDRGMLEIALAGAGVVLMPDMMIESYLADGRLTRLGKALEGRDLELFLTTRANQRQNAIARIETLLSDGVAS